MKFTQENIAILRRDNKKFREIAAIFNLSKQRVHQKLTGYDTKSKSKQKREAKVRDGLKCSACPRKRKLHVHHIDGNFKNNNLDNLITFCPHHHAEAEEELRVNKIKERHYLPRKLIKCICGFCQEEFSEIKRPRQKMYCSRSCFTNFNLKKNFGTTDLNVVKEARRLRYNARMVAMNKRRYWSDPKYREGRLKSMRKYFRKLAALKKATTSV